MPIDPTKPLIVVLTSDPALAPEMNVIEYIATREPDLIKERQGMKAVRFQLVPIPRPQLIWIDEQFTQPLSRYRWALLASLREIVNAAGKIIPAPKLNHVLSPGEDAWTYAPGTWFEQISKTWGQDAAYLLGKMAHDYASLPETGALPLD